MLCCVTEKNLPYSPIDGIRVSAGIKRKYFFLTPCQFDDLHGEFHEHYRDAIETAVTTGVRPGELWELRGRDIGQKPGRLRVERAVSDVGGVMVLDATKTGEPRDVPGLSHIEKMLKRRANTVGPEG